MAIGLEESRLQDIVETFNDQAENPPAGDRYIGACYVAVLQMMNDDKSSMELFIRDIERQKKMTSTLFVNLFLRAAQYLSLGPNRNGYPLGYDNPDKWRTRLSDSLPEIAKLMVEKDTVTTIYERYAGPFAIIHALGNEKGVNVVDLGCGGNYGLKGKAINEPFKLFKDKTPNQQVLSWLNKPVSLNNGLAVDKYDPNDPEMVRWRRACQFYPSELGKMDEIIALEERLSVAERVRFAQADIREAGLEARINGKRWDAVIMSTVLYQMDDRERESVINNAEDFVRGGDKGICIIQDFVNVESEGKLNFKVSWGVPFNYRTVIKGLLTDWEFWEVFQWNNGRCKEVRPGKDWDKFYDILESRNLNIQTIDKKTVISKEVKEIVNT